jgi:U3 small nucleolar RNA-associated protein 3
MLQASKALNLSMYLLLKADQASAKSHSTPTLESNDNSFLMDDDINDIQSHPVMDRLNQLSQLTDKLKENVEDKTPGLEKQMRSLVKAAALMKGESVDSTDDESGAEIDPESEDKLVDAKPISDASEASSSDEEDEAAIQRRVMTEAKFALRNKEVETSIANSSNKRNRRAAPPSSMDYGDDAEEISERAVEAGRRLASTMNSISQKSHGKNKKNIASVEDEDDEYEQLQRGLSMMNEELGMGSDDEGGSDNAEEEEGFDDDDEDDFYSKIKSKSKAKKEAKKQMYAVAPKYPRLDEEVEGKSFTAIGYSMREYISSCHYI